MINLLANYQKFRIEKCINKYINLQKMISLHNKTLNKREETYIESLNTSPVEGKIDLF